MTGFCHKGTICFSSVGPVGSQSGVGRVGSQGGVGGNCEDYITLLFCQLFGPVNQLERLGEKW